MLPNIYKNICFAWILPPFPSSRASNVRWYRHFIIINKDPTASINFTIECLHCVVSLFVHYIFVHLLFRHKWHKNSPVALSRWDKMFFSFFLFITVGRRMFNVRNKVKYKLNLLVFSIPFDAISTEYNTIAKCESKINDKKNIVKRSFIRCRWRIICNKNQMINVFMKLVTDASICSPERKTKIKKKMMLSEMDNAKNQR